MIGKNRDNMPDLDSFYIKIADITVEMRHKYAFTRQFCRDYVTDGVNGADIIASASPTEVKAESQLYGTPHSEGYCENICLYRSIAEQIPFLDRFVFHGAAVAIDGVGFIFAAPSGTGKTTHVRLLMNNFCDRVSIINGDKPIISLAGDKATVCSTPWAGKEKWHANTSAELGGICLLKRGSQNSIKRISPAEYFDEMIRQVYIPKDTRAMEKTLELLDRLSSRISFYLLECDISDDAAKTSFDMLSEDIIKAP